MKSILIILCLVSVVTLTNCKGSADMDYAKAKSLCENCLKSIDAGDAQAVIDNYYSSELSAGSKDDLANKFAQLKNTTGALVSYALKDSSMSAEIGEEAKVILTYEVKHSNATTTEKFVVSDQGGNYRITNHSINN